MTAYFFDGVIFLGFIVIAAHFIKFWAHSRDKFFLLFAIAFFLLGVERFCIAVFIGRTTDSYIYLVRLIAICLILTAVALKNRD